MQTTYREGKALDLILERTDCRTVSEAIGYLNQMYADGMSITDILNYLEFTHGDIGA